MVTRMTKEINDSKNKNRLIDNPIVAWQVHLTRPTKEHDENVGSTKQQGEIWLVGLFDEDNTNFVYVNESILQFFYRWWHIQAYHFYFLSDFETISQDIKMKNC